MKLKISVLILLMIANVPIYALAPSYKSTGLDPFASRNNLPVDLWQAYQDAVKFDPIFQEQIATFMEDKESVPQARAAFLPQILLDAQTSNTHEVTTLSGKNYFYSPTYSVNINQALFNLSAFEQLKQAKTSVRASAALLSYQKQDLIVRVIIAYLNILQAQDLLNYTKQQEIYAMEFYRDTNERFKLKDSTITDLKQAQGQYELMKSQYVSAKINLYNKIQDLGAITGRNYQKLKPFSNNFPLIQPKPNEIDPWIKKSLSNNLSLLSAKLNADAAKEQINAVRGNFLPTLSAFGSYQNSNELSTLISGAVVEHVRVGVAGLDLKWQLLEGGMNVSKLRQAMASYKRILSVLKQSYTNVMVNTKNSFIGIHDGVYRVKNSKIAMEATYVGLMTTNEALRAGIRSTFDLLQAQTRLYEAQKQYIQDFYSYISDTILLKQAAGILSPCDVMQLNKWLVHTNNKDKDILDKDYKLMSTKSKIDAGSKKLLASTGIKSKQANKFNQPAKFLVNQNTKTTIASKSLPAFTKNDPNYFKQSMAIKSKVNANLKPNKNNINQQLTSSKEDRKLVLNKLNAFMKLPKENSVRITTNKNQPKLSTSKAQVSKLNANKNISHKTHVVKVYRSNQKIRDNIPILITSKKTTPAKQITIKKIKYPLTLTVHKQLAKSNIRSQINS